MQWHCGAAHRWKGAAGGNLFRVDLQRQMKCDVPTPREILHPQHLQAQEFRRQWGQTHGLQATMRIWHIHTIYILYIYMVWGLPGFLTYLRFVYIFANSLYSKFY